MLTRDRIQTELEALILEATNEPHTYSLRLHQTEHFEITCDDSDDHEPHPHDIVSVNNIHIPYLENDTAYDEQANRIIAQYVNEIMNDLEFWEQINIVTNELGIECEWTKEEEYTTDLTNIYRVHEWIMKPQYAEHTLEHIQQAICANWLTAQARDRIAKHNLSATQSQAYLYLLAPQYEYDSQERLRALINQAQEIIGLQEMEQHVKEMADKKQP
jgi:hypothetical protein